MSLRAAWRFGYGKEDKGDGQERGQACDPKDQVKVVVRGCHEERRCEWAKEGAHGVHRLTQAVRRTPLGFGGDVGDESVTRGAAYPFTDAIEKAGSQHRFDAVGEWKERFAHGSEAVSEQNQRFATLETVGERPRENFDHGGGRFRYAFDDPYRNRRGAKDSN